MSFLDLATLTMHRRNELEARIQVCVEKCDNAIRNINKLKKEAKGLVERLNCDPSDFKEQFLSCMKQLDEYTYLMTDFNLAMGKLEESNSTNQAPDFDTSSRVLPPSLPFNLMDTLMEPTPSTSAACYNQCPITKRKHTEELIQFSSTSCSSESMLVKSETMERDIHNTSKAVMNMKLEDSPKHSFDNINLPAQTVLQVDKLYEACILHVDSWWFWVTTDNIDDTFKQLQEMNDFYSKNKIELTLEEAMSLTYCAVYEEDTNCYYRGLFLKISKEDVTLSEVFLVDLGEMRVVPTITLQPLHRRFCVHPPFARCCHLAGIDPLTDEISQKQQEELMTKYIAATCTILVDDNTSESLGVYVTLPNGEKINDIMVKVGLAVKTDKSISQEHSVRESPSPRGVPELTAERCDITQCPEYEDPVLAVTGYHNRDEADICKHYKGGPEKTCFKGARCTKKHIVKHPEGWTLDRVPVAGKLRSPPLPPPGASLRVLVTHVAHFNKFYVHFVTDTKPEPLPSFGVVLPPSTLPALIRDMNTPSTKTAYKPLKTMPAAGELVAALYPMDGQWYRARVVSVTRADQELEVMYVDYGNRVWVKEDAVRVLEPRFCVLPAQAVLCTLAGVALRGTSLAAPAIATRALETLIQNETFDARVIAMGYNEITVELLDSKGNKVAEELAKAKVVNYKEYTVEYETYDQKIYVP